MWKRLLVVFHSNPVFDAWIPLTITNTIKVSSWETSSCASSLFPTPSPSSLSPSPPSLSSLLPFIEHLLYARHRAGCCVHLIALNSHNNAMTRGDPDLQMGNWDSEKVKWPMAAPTTGKRGSHLGTSWGSLGRGGQESKGGSRDVPRCTCVHGAPGVPLFPLTVGSSRRPLVLSD